jgi:2,3-bisphosphoglycerate-independent phosphoglycerate mutase
MRVLLLFVDGLGLGSDDPAINPIHSGVCPNLERFLREHAVPVDAGLGVPGVPQSATGQTALLTGVNAAQAVGRHVEGFPGAKLKVIIREHNIFRQFAQRGLTSTFANAYFVDSTATVEEHRIQSVTTVATLSAFGKVRDKQSLLNNDAVYQDLTRESLRERGYDGPLVTPAQCAEHLAAIAARYDLTLFEYFQTDRVGHKSDAAKVRHVLAVFDEFLGGVLRLTAGRLDLILTSDHGNIEDMTQAGHTLNPVPFAVVGPAAQRLQSQVRSLTDVTPALLSLR